MGGRGGTWLEMATPLGARTKHKTIDFRGAEGVFCFVLFFLQQDRGDVTHTATEQTALEIARRARELGADRIFSIPLSMSTKAQQPRTGPGPACDACVCGRASGNASASKQDIGTE
jgi:hypothetical protein